MRNALMPLMLAVTLLAGCDRRNADMVVRTFDLAQLNATRAADIITPYISEGGLATASGTTLTVRETRERLDEIEALLEKYDEATPVLLRFQVIEADGFTERDSAIADVEATLREMFRYRGYRLVRELVVRATEGHSFQQADEELQLQGAVLNVTTEDRVPLEVGLRTRGGELRSTVTARVGETTVVGAHSVGSGGGALILAVRPVIDRR